VKAQQDNRSRERLKDNKDMKCIASNCDGKVAAIGTAGFLYLLYNHKSRSSSTDWHTINWLQ
jgi:hypothetical protein